MIEVIHYRGIAAREAARIAIDHHLFIDGWYLITALSMIAAGCRRSDPQIALVFKHRIPIAVAVEEGFGQVMAFVSKAERRKGYGSLAVNALDIDPAHMYADAGVPGSPFFWDSVHLSVRSRRCTEAIEA